MVLRPDKKVTLKFAILIMTQDPIHKLGEVKKCLNRRDPKALLTLALNSSTGFIGSGDWPSLSDTLQVLVFILLLDGLCDPVQRRGTPSSSKVVCTIPTLCT
jgi:hypothetical protein